MQLVPIKILLSSFLFGFFLGGEMNDGFISCLPKDIKPEEVVSAPELKSSTKATAKKVTVREILSKLKARCTKGKLVDGNGREVYFYRLLGCWGNPPEDYREQIARQNEELQRLKKKYTVVEIPCAQANPGQIQYSGCE
jgi:hypothetical protein